ncbi:MAG: pyridoxine 5'-phosphate synthase [Bacteroidia bacterium]|nr:pyridoxine 5'-phosphate synthase [Bacteroidia bacterium]MCX7763278.1 pyridoxine 5'-phosphate synthase [Bacteroidia bacterium]MDW8057575.1 pyridoxine 5'-phosphate synthase [Bacteroidia bacterium]
MTRLSVNVNKVALLRNSRGGNIPDVIAFAQTCERLGADGITVHPRPDERHIRRADVYALRDAIGVELNVEGFPSEEYLQLLEQTRPAQATLVPDPPHALTSDRGWDVIGQRDFLKPIITRLKEQGIRVSIFIDPLPEQVEAAAEVGADCVELYTGPYAHQFSKSPKEAILPYILAAQKAQEVGLRLHAGHDLNLQNLRFLRLHLPNLAEVSIGHALIADALYYGIEETLRRYKQALA